jgi:hypothetical protein
MDDYRESAAEFAALNEPAQKRVYTEVALDIRDATSVPLDKIAPNVLTRLVMTHHHRGLLTRYPSTTSTRARTLRTSG